MSHLLWLHFLDNDLDGFRHTLALASQSTSHPKSRSYHGSHSTSPGASLSTSPTVTRGKRGAERTGKGKNAETVEISRNDANWKDLQGRTLLHLIVSSTEDNTSEFADALLRLPLLDLYEQDEENGWTALHRALYMGNVTIARALIARDLADAGANYNPHAQHGTVAGLIKIKDNEGNSPFDVYGSTMGPQPAPRSDPLLHDTGEELEGYLGASDDSSSEDDAQHVVPRTLINGDEVYALGSNKNFTLGFSDEDDRQFPERIHFQRPDALMHRYFEEYKERERKAGKAATENQPFGMFELPACVRYRRMQIQDVQLAKLSSAILTNDVEANLYMCGFGSGGRLGTGDEITRFNYVNIRGGGLAGKRLIAVALGQNHTIAISSHGETFTWGNNMFGQLGYASNTTTKDEEPAQLLPKHVFGPLKRETAVGAAASRIHSAVFTASSLYTFGKNEGQMGLVDADARSLTSQTTPRKVGASLITSPIKSVSAIDKATICLLQSHEVLVFANYGYTKVNFHVDSAAKFLQDLGQSADRFGQGRPVMRGNEVTKIAAAGDTICAMTAMGDVSTVQVSRQEPSATPSSTTNPSKIKGALSAPQLIWSLKKAHMAVRDVEVGQDGSIIICTESGSVWRRIKRAKIKDASANTSHKAKDYKFSRVPGLTRIAAVRSNAFGGFAAIRRNTDMLRTWPQCAEPRLRQDIQPLSPFSGFCVDDSDAENPLPRYWVSKQIPEVAKLRRAIMSSDRLDNLRLEEDVGSFLRDHVDRRARGFDLSICTTSSKVQIPIHSFMFAGRSSVIDKAMSEFRVNYFYAVPDTVDVEYDADGRPVLRFHSIDFISLINLVLYIYTDTIISVWQFPRQSREQSTRYRQIRNEMMKVSAALDMKKLEHAVRLMNQTPRTMDDDLEQAIKSPTFFENADMEIELDGASQTMHSAFACRRCPFLEGMFQGRAQGRWISARVEESEESEPVKVDMTHVEPHIFSFVLRHIYADADERIFDGVVTADLDAYLDLIIDVMSVANEMMLDRLSRCCQLVLTRYVNTRNVCQLLNAVAPCSVTEFKTAALDYICHNLEGMLENHLLDDLDDDLMLELDVVVRQNQLICMPFVKSGRKEADLLERHPELVEQMERERRVRIDRMLLQSKLREKERVGLRPANDLLEDFETPPVKKSQSNRRSSDAKSPPLLGKQKSSQDLMFELEGHEDQKTSPRMRQRGSSNDQVQRHLNSLELPEAAMAEARGASSFEPDNIGRAVDQNSANTKQPWAATSLTPSKLDMKEIMAQASSSRSSNLSSALAQRNKQPHTPVSPTPAQQSAAGLPVKLSQKERKRLQQQQADKARLASTEPESPTIQPQSATPTPEKPIPWQRVTSNPRVSMKEVLAGSPSSSPSSAKSTKAAGTGNTAPSMTLRQTVAGGGAKPPPTRRAVSEPIQAMTPPSTSTTRPSPSPNTTKSRTQALLSPPRSLSTSTYTPAVSIPESGIKSIQHAPPSSSSSTAAKEAAGSWGTSMDEILAQQIGEKEALKDALAKRSLSEIQEEQAFEVWWDRESKRVQGVDVESVGGQKVGTEKGGKGEKRRRRVRTSRGGGGAGTSAARVAESGKAGSEQTGEVGRQVKKEGTAERKGSGPSGKKSGRA